MAIAQLLSPLPGIFYHRASPDSPMFKLPGDAIAIGEVIGLIEVMKSFNEVRADAAGRLIRYLVNHESEVMPGEPIAEIDA